MRLPMDKQELGGKTLCRRRLDRYRHRRRAFSQGEHACRMRFRGSRNLFV
jgi:hypothetical protein